MDAGTKIDASAKLMAFSLYEVDLGLEDPRGTFRSPRRAQALVSEGVP